MRFSFVRPSLSLNRESKEHQIRRNVSQKDGRQRDPIFAYGGGRAKSAGARLLKWLLTIMLTLGCSVSSAQIEPDAGKWKTWVLTSGERLEFSPAAPQARAERTQSPAANH